MNAIRKKFPWLDNLAAKNKQAAADHKAAEIAEIIESNNPYSAWKYALEQNQRVPEMEKLFIQYPVYAYAYACRFIKKGEWPEGIAMLKERHPTYWVEYLKHRAKKELNV